MLALSILAGEDQHGNPLIRPRDLTPVKLGSATLWPVAPSSSLFGYQVPSGQSLIWTYLTMYTTLADESTLAVNYGVNFYAGVQIQEQTGGLAVFQPRTAVLQPQIVFNTPLLLIFDGDITPRIFLTPNGSTQTIGSQLWLATVHGYLLSAGLASALRPYETKFPSV